MGFRLKAFGLHLAGSACALSLVLGGLYLGWYRWPGWYLASALQVAGILIAVDVVLGPTMTLIIANPGKRQSALARDIGVIVAVQLVALAYGTITLWEGRPLFYTFSVGMLELVQASDLKDVDIVTAQRQHARFAPYWYSRPQWIWAPLPDDPDEARRIATGAVFGGTDVIQMPRYFHPWEQGLPEVRKSLQAVGDIKYFSKKEKKALGDRIAQLGLPVDKPDALVLWGGSRRVLAVFDPRTLRIRALLKAD